MIRRNLLAGLCGLAGASVFGAGALRAQTADDISNLGDVWRAWKASHLASTGRVIDRLQQNSSHSEGQGYGLLLAAVMGDARSFEQMETWTRVNLAIRADTLMAWRWLPDTPERVPDLNNASDGDLFRAWALMKAADAFGVAEYRDRAAAIVADLVTTCIVARPDRIGMMLMLPAAQGFQTDEGFIYNPSYAMPLAMMDLANAFDAPELASAADGAVQLMRDLASGGVVPDWVLLTPSGPRAAEGFSFDAGYEAVRAPLYLVWSDMASHPAVARYAQAQANLPPGLAATVISRQSGGVLATDGAAGYNAVAALTACAASDQIGSRIPPFAPTDPYYPATLHLFALLAQMHAEPRCLPL
jgi:endoglucanase